MHNMAKMRAINRLVSELESKLKFGSIEYTKAFQIVQFIDESQDALRYDPEPSDSQYLEWISQELSNALKNAENNHEEAVYHVSRAHRLTLDMFYDSNESVERLIEAFEMLISTIPELELNKSEREQFHLLAMSARQNVEKLMSARHGSSLELALTRLILTTRVAISETSRLAECRRLVRLGDLRRSELLKYKINADSSYNLAKEYRNNLHSGAII